LLSRFPLSRSSPNRLPLPFSVFPRRTPAAEHAIRNHVSIDSFSPNKYANGTAPSPAEPHPAASDRNNQLADFVADEWRKQGWEDVTLRRYDVFALAPLAASPSK